MFIYTISTLLVLLCLQYIGFVSRVSEMIWSLCFNLQKEVGEIYIFYEIHKNRKCILLHEAVNIGFKTSLYRILTVNRTLNNQTRVAFCFLLKREMFFEHKYLWFCPGKYKFVAIKVAFAITFRVPFPGKNRVTRSFSAVRKETGLNNATEWNVTINPFQLITKIFKDL